MRSRSSRGGEGNRRASNATRGVELALLAGRRSLGGERPPDPQLAKAALDPLGAPAVERALVLGEAVGEAHVVEVALLDQLRHGLVGDLRLHAPTRQMRAHLDLRPVPMGEEPVAEPERSLELLGQATLLRWFRPQGQSEVWRAKTKPRKDAGRVQWQRHCPD